MEVNQAKLYDRQIQIFGTETQQRISAAEVVIYGLNTVTMEVAKNLALIGFNVALCDARPLSLKDIQDSPLLGDCDKNSTGEPIDQVHVSKLLEMNPHVRISTVAEPLESAFSENTHSFIAACQSFEAAEKLSLRLQHMNSTKLYLFQSNYRFLALIELQDDSFRLTGHSAAQIKERLLSEHGLNFDFSEAHTPSLDDFVLHCMYGATLNQTLLTLVAHNRLVYNALYMDLDGKADNPAHHRRLECVLLK